MWSIQLAFRLLISCRIFLCSLTLSNTSSFLTWSVGGVLNYKLAPHVVRDNTRNHLRRSICQSVLVVFHTQSTLSFPSQERPESNFFSLHFCQEHTFFIYMHSEPWSLSVCIQELRTVEQIFVTFDTEKFRKNAHTHTHTHTHTLFAWFEIVLLLLGYDENTNFGSRSSGNVILYYSLLISWCSDVTSFFNLQGFRSPGGMQKVRNKWRYSIYVR